LTRRWDRRRETKEGKNLRGNEWRVAGEREGGKPGRPFPKKSGVSRDFRVAAELSRETIDARIWLTSVKTAHVPTAQGRGNEWDNSRGKEKTPLDAFPHNSSPTPGGEFFRGRLPLAGGGDSTRGGGDWKVQRSRQQQKKRKVKR